MNFKTCTLLFLNFTIVIVVLTYFGLVAWQALIIPLVVWITLTVLGVFNIRWNFFLKAIHKGSGNNRQIALTFDDGPHPTYTPQVLEILKAHGIQATFFCIGKQVSCHPKLVRELRSHGHIVANHSFSHAATIDFHSTATWVAELQQTDAAIADAIGRQPRFFRPPYGVTTPHLAAATQQTKQTVIGWTARPYDTLPRSPRQIVDTILKQTGPGSIILLHDTHSRIISVLEQLLPELKKRNFELVTIEKLIQRDAYTNIQCG